MGCAPLSPREDAFPTVQLLEAECGGYQFFGPTRLCIDLAESRERRPRDRAMTHEIRSSLLVELTGAVASRRFRPANVVRAERVTEVLLRTDRCCLHHVFPLARFEGHALGHPRQRSEMELAIGALDSFGPNDRSGVVEHVGTFGIPLGQAEDDIDVEFARELRDALSRRTGDGLGQGIMFGAMRRSASADLACLDTNECLLGKCDQVDTLGRCLADIGVN